VLKQVLRSRASRALAQDDSAAHVRRNEREGGFSFPPYEASEPVILSAAGAKDLLFPTPPASER